MPRKGCKAIWVLLVMFVAAGTTAPASAECTRNDSQCRKAERLVDRLGYAQSIRQLRSLCVDSLSALHPDRAFAEEPDAFFGIKPASQSWPRVLKSFEIFVQDACGGDALEQVLLDRYVTSWNAKLTERELDAAIAFLRSQPGHAFARAMVDSHRDASNYYEERVAANRRIAFERFRRQVEQIARDTAFAK